MKRFIVGILCAFAGWIIGSHFSNLLSWTGVVVGFLLGLIFEDVEETKEIIIEARDKTVYRSKKYKWDWKGTAIYFGIIFLSLLTTINWCLTSGLLLNCTEGSLPKNSFLNIFFCILSSFSIMGSVGSMFLLVFSAHFFYKGLKSKTIPRIRVFIRKELSIRDLLLAQPQGLVIYGIYKIPSIVRCTSRLLARMLCFVGRCLLRLISEEKKLTFAICTASGTALGLYFGREVVCGLSGSVVAGILILISDKTRVWLEKKQGNCVYNT